MGVRNTSREAYFNEVKPNLGEKQVRVLNAFKRSKRPANNQEIADHLDQAINTVTPRTYELVGKGLIEEAFRDIYPVTGRKVIYWTPTKKGRTV